MTFEWVLDLGDLREQLVEVTVANDRVINCTWYGPDVPCNLTPFLTANKRECERIVERALELANMPRDPFDLARASYVY